MPRNVLGGELEPCSTDPMTGFYRDGCCRTGPDDAGVHVVCAQVTAEFLEFSKERGNDLSTPRPELGFRGLVPGDRWCLCADRWAEALDAGAAPPVVLASTAAAATEWADLDDLRQHAVDGDPTVVGQEPDSQEPDGQEPDGQESDGQESDGPGQS